MAKDWVDDLKGFGPEIVADACTDWRRTQSKRPTPADIRARCIAINHDRHEDARLKALPAPRRPERRALTDYESLEARSFANDWARKQGYDDFDAYLEAGGTYAEACKKIVNVADAPEASVRRSEQPSPEKLAADRQSLIDTGLMEDEEP